MIIGYARVSTHKQKVDSQIDDLKRAGVEKIYVDIISRVTQTRPEFDKMMEVLRPKDQLVITRLSRLSGSLKHLIELSAYLERNDIQLRSLKETIDTSTPAGKMIFHFFGAVAQFQRDNIIDGTLSGLASARARGRLGGRPEKFSQEKQKIAVNLYLKKEVPLRDICETFGISKPTLYRYVRIYEKVVPQ